MLHNYPPSHFSTGFNEGNNGIYKLMGTLFLFFKEKEVQVFLFFITTLIEATIIIPASRRQIYTHPINLKII